MTTIADPITIAGLKIRNRIVMPPMVTRLATDSGEVTAKLIEHYEKRSKGGVGLIIVEASAITWEHRISENNIGVHDDSLIEGLGRLADGIKKHGARAFIQLNHSGPKKYHSARFVGPSPIPVMDGPVPEELTIDEMMQIKDLFIEAACRVKEAGFDGAEIHAAHFFLLSSFLSSYSNQRADEYGGNIQNKTKFVVDVIKGVKRKVGSFPVQCRINGIENYIRGIDVEEAKQIAQILVNAGLDSLNVSGYMSPMFNEEKIARFSRENKPSIFENFPWGCYIPCTAEIKKVVNIPVIGVGMVRTAEFAEKVIRENLCDLVAVGRGHLADPEFASKVLNGKGDKIIQVND
jgi:2,4-dienoyl-CoA reductase-like NADH-dependent reductase (Old Yellow Enzyme family)